MPVTSESAIASKTAAACLTSGAASDVLVWHNGRPVTRMTFMAEAARLAERLPDRPYAVNLCGGRYPFLVAALAAFLRGQQVVLPNDRSARFAEQLCEDFPGLYALTDETAQDCVLMATQVRPRLTASGHSGELPAALVERASFIVFTSGSTGRPQPHLKPLSTLRFTARAISQRFGLEGSRAPTIVATVPAQHMYGLENTIALPLWSEAAVHSARPLYPADIAAALESVPAPRMLVTTPVHLRALLASEVELPALQMILSATAPLTAETARRAEERYGTELHEIYGFSEAGTVATRRSIAGDTWLTCQGITLERHGTIFQVMAPHLPEPVAVNDEIELLAPDRFNLRGRLSDNINIAGKRASLSGLNSILTELPGVTDGAFYLEDDDSDEKVHRLVAFVVAPGRPAAEIRAGLKRSLDPAFMPRRIHLLPRLPRAENGKLTRHALAALATRLARGK